MSEQPRYALLIVGGGPAGLAAARAFREHRDDGAVAIVTDEHALPYRRPPLTKALLTGEARLEELPLEDEAWFEEHRVALVGGRAVALDTGSRTVTLSGGRELAYETCLLSTGAEPTKLTVPGADHPRVSVMRGLEDLRRLLDRLDDDVRVTVVGSGFIACEIAASLRRRGHPVGLVSAEAAPNRERLGAEAAARIAGWLAEDGVELFLDAPVQRVDHARGVCRVRAGSTRLESDLVIMGTGVAPRGELARAAGLALVGGAIPVDAGMRSERPGLLAAGDVARAENLRAGRALRVEHWGDALGQGAVAGQTAAGLSPAWDAVPGFWSTIGTHTLKYAAWGDGHDEAVFVDRGEGAFSVDYLRKGALVGCLTHGADEVYEQAYERIQTGTPLTA